MSEDYTWDETVTAHGYAVQNAGLRRDNATLAARVMELTRENAELRARLDAVWDYARYYRAAMWELEQEDWRGEVLDLGEWIADGKPRAGTLQKTKGDWREQQDTDAPLTLAPLDEDGDE